MRRIGCIRIILLTTGIALLGTCFIGLLIWNWITVPAQQNTLALLTTHVPTVAPARAATPTGRTQVPHPLAAAWNKFIYFESMSVDFELDGEGKLGTLPGSDDATGQFTLMHISGKMDLKTCSADVTMKGLLGLTAGADPNKGMEFLVVGDKQYLRGPAPLMGVPDDQWYVSKTDTNVSCSTTPKKTDPAGPFGDKNPDWNRFTKTGQETIDGQACDVYSADSNGALQLLKALGFDDIKNMDGLKQLDTADAKLWVCADGYLHQLQLNASKRPPAGLPGTLGLQVFMHVSDYDKPVILTPPAHALPLQTPTPTPPAKR